MLTYYFLLPALLLLPCCHGMRTLFFVTIQDEKSNFLPLSIPIMRPQAPQASASCADPNPHLQKKLNKRVHKVHNTALVVVVVVAVAIVVFCRYVFPLSLRTIFIIPSAVLRESV